MAFPELYPWHVCATVPPTLRAADGELEQAVLAQGRLSHNCISGALHAVSLIAFFALRAKGGEERSPSTLQWGL